jgi:small subunit ribosomal protein S17
MKVFEGIVTSAKLPKTVTVKVQRYFEHPLYKKRMKLTKKFLCHCELSVTEGELVSIQECKPMSAKKRFIVTAKLGGKVMEKIVEEVKKEEKPKTEKVGVKVEKKTVKKAVK